jgi:hypothetical protein
MRVNATLRIDAARPVRLFACVALIFIAVGVGNCGSGHNPGWGDQAGGGGGGSHQSSGGPGGPGLGNATPDGGSSGSGLVFGVDAGADQSSSGTVNGMPVFTINDCPGAVSGANVTALQGAAGSNPSSMTWLYPYDKTVFPAGIVAPTLQWSQSNGPDAVYLHLHSNLFDYQGCFAGSNPPQLDIPQQAYDAAFVHGGGPTDPLAVEVTTITGGTVSGPIRETWTLARGNLKGIIYYNTYTSQLASQQLGGGDGGIISNGAVMSIAPGATMPNVLLTISGVSPIGPCVSCHSISANGKYMAAQRHDYLFAGNNASGLLQSESYDLSSASMLDPNADAGTGNGAALAINTNDDWGFSGMYPDGSRLLTSGESNATNPPFPAASGNNPGMIGPSASKMFNPQTGASINFTGLSAQYAMMPMFSPDGTKIVFNDYDHGMGHSLVVQDFDPATNTFSNAKTIFTDPNLYPGWPFFTPDAKWVVFALGNNDNFATTNDPPLQTIGTSDLYIVAVAGGNAQALDAANGYANGQSYLPYPGRDEHLNFYTTVSPISSAGYFWIYFTSRRNYGNMLAANNATLTVADDTDPTSMKIWVTPIETNESGQVISHPAFYLTGQELVSGNIRAFAALEPCKTDGKGTCQSGIDCCGGFCTNGMCGMPPGPPRCSNLDEKCTKKSDCCDPLQDCIGGFCAIPKPT